MDMTQVEGNTAKLEQARLEVYEPGEKPGQKGAFRLRIDFQFNPKDLTITKGVKWNANDQKTAGSAPPTSFTSPEAQKMTLEMFFDATRSAGADVVKDVDALFSTLVPTPASMGKTPSPPFVKFFWGPLTGFLGYVKSVAAKYTLFGKDGRPLRAVCTVALEELPSDLGKQNPTSGGLQPRRVFTVREGDTLPVIAYREYGQASLWRPLAEVNGIDDPMRVRPGRTLYLPTARELERPDALDVARAEVSRART
jgi:nucleoid-associated protein YgaU